MAQTHFAQVSRSTGHLKGVAKTADKTVAQTTAAADRLLRLANAAVAHHRAGRLTEAVAAYRQIILRDGDLPEIHNNLGRALADLGSLDDAEAEFRRAVELKPRNPETLCNWGVVLAELGRMNDAEAKYRTGIAIDPGFAGAHNNLGLLLKEKGRFAEARQAIEQAIRLAPGRASYYDNLGAVRTFTAGDDHVAALQAMAANAAALPDADRAHLHFALGKACDDTGQNDEAMRHLLAANAFKRQLIAYDEAATLGRMARIREIFSRDFMDAHRGGGDPSSLPVFILGMPRSGTTLIEQVLSSHPQVFGAGELFILDQAAGSVRDTLPGRPDFPDMMLEMWAKHFRTLAGLYLERLKQVAPGAARITDKMTTNFLLAGLIHLALPNAVIIHAVRNPIDTCVSCFAMNFTKGLAHTYDLAELGRYYRHYQALMTHWHDVLPPGRILDVHYEELVGDLESVARRIVSHCGLTWDDRCLEFHRTERFVRTASAAQVRKPVYTSSVGRWRRYEKFLGPLLAELGSNIQDPIHNETQLKEKQYA